MVSTHLWCSCHSKVTANSPVWGHLRMRTAPSGLSQTWSASQGWNGNGAGVKPTIPTWQVDVNGIVLNAGSLAPHQLSSIAIFFCVSWQFVGLFWRAKSPWKPPRKSLPYFCWSNQVKPPPPVSGQWLPAAARPGWRASKMANGFNGPFECGQLCSSSTIQRTIQNVEVYWLYLEVS